MIELDELFDEWEQVENKKDRYNFIKDGIVNETVWQNQSYKICFFLKEAYLGKKEKEDGFKWNLVKDTLDKGVIRKMWHSVAEWTYGIINTNENSIPEHKSLSYEEKCALLKMIAVVNVKKCDGKPNSDYNNLSEIIADEDNKSFTYRELFDIIKPNIIICGNNYSLLRAVLDNKIPKSQELSNNYFWYGDILIIDFFHPANYFPKFMNFYTLCSIYQQALKARIK